MRDLSFIYFIFIAYNLNIKPLKIPFSKHGTLPYRAGVGPGCISWGLLDLSAQYKLLDNDMEKAI
jgi:hypothetical protein